MRLPVTSIERYHLCDDTVQNPNVIACELTFSGELDLDIATSAVRDVARRHPMVYARLEERRWRRNVWNIDPANIDELQIEVVSPQSGDLRVIEPKQTAGTRILFEELENGLSRLSFRTHHASMDGGGGLQLVNDWLLAYERISSGSEKPKSRRTDIELLRKRNHLRLLNREFIAKLWVQPVAMLGAIKFLFRRVVTIAETDLPVTGSEAGLRDFQVISHCFDAGQATRLKVEASDTRATINELVLRAVFLGLHQYRKKRKLHKKNEWLRLIIPINIRDYADRRLPAANRATLVQLDRTDLHFSSPARMIWGLNYELGFVRRWNLVKTFLLGLRWLSVIPGLVPRMARKDVCRATSVVTNLGAPFERNKLDRIDGKLRSGGLIVHDVNLIVPLRSGTPIGFAVVRYAGQMYFDMHFDPKQLRRETAREIMDLVVAHLEATPYAEAARASGKGSHQPS